MAWIAALIGAGGAAASGSAAGKANSKGGKRAALAGKFATNRAIQGMAPYQGIGEASALSLGELMGLKGYRTQEEIDFNKYLKTAPKAPGYTKYGYGNDQDKFINAAPVDPQLMGNILAHGNPMMPMPGLGNFAGGMSSDAKKDEAIARQWAIHKAKKKYEQDMAKYTADKNAWEEGRNQKQYAYNQSLENYDPLKVLQATPGYQARYNQGQDAVTANQVGRQLGGRAAQELQQYGQSFASNEYQNELARRQGVAGMGQNAANATGNWAVGQGNNLSNIALQQGQNEASLYGSYNNVLQGTLKNYLSAGERQKDRDAGFSTYSGV